MSKAVLISIKPEWCAKIASGEKTIEVRKTRPKLPTPFKCYIYCTMPRKHFSVGGGLTFSADDLYRSASGKIKYGDSLELMCYDGCTKDNFLNGKVIGEFVCDRIEHFDVPYPAYQKKLDKRILEQSCLTYYQLHRYAYHDDLYGWHISELKIYDTPKELSEFCRWEKLEVWEYPKKITRATQSWCYVEEFNRKQGGRDH